MLYDKTNTPWNDAISNEDVLDKTFDLSYLVRTNQHLALFRLMQTMMVQKYQVVARFDYMGYNGHAIYANGQQLVSRPSKRAAIKLGKDVEFVAHNLLSPPGGSHVYPSVAWSKASCTVRFISYGLPKVDKNNGWSIHVLSIEPIE